MIKNLWINIAIPCQTVDREKKSDWVGGGAVSGFRAAEDMNGNHHITVMSILIAVPGSLVY